MDLEPLQVIRRFGEAEEREVDLHLEPEGRGGSASMEADDARRQVARIKKLVGQ